MTMPKLVIEQKVLLMVILMVACHTEAANLQLAWDPSPSQVAGYNLYYGQSNRDYDTVVDIGNRTSYTLSGLESGQRYYLTITAYDSMGNESASTNEVSGIPSSSDSSPSNLVAAYAFNERNGSTVSDASGEGNHSTIVGAKWTPQGRFGNALTFDGVDDWVSINGAPALDLTTSLTLTAWVYPTATLSGRQTVILGESGTRASYYLYANSDRNRPTIGIGVGGNYQELSGTSPLRAKLWTHLAGTYDGATLRLFQDGVEIGSRSLSGSAYEPNTRLAFGGNSLWGDFFQGRIDEVRIYNRVLTAREIQEVMNTSLPPLGAGGHLDEDTSATSLTGESEGRKNMIEAHTDGERQVFDPSPGRRRRDGQHRASNDSTAFDISTADPSLGSILQHLVSERIEIGEVQVDHQWKRVELRKPFLNPVVVAKALSGHHPAPIVVQLRDVVASGFEIALQPWDDRISIHTPETVGYLVIERGSYTLANGIRVEAGIVKALRPHLSTPIHFGQEFAVVPVVMTALMSGDEAEAASGRPMMVSKDRFQYRSQTSSQHEPTDIPVNLAYVAWEPSWGAIDGLTFEVKRSRLMRRDSSHTIGFEGIFQDAPVFLADVQGPADKDVLGVLWSHKNLDRVVVMTALDHTGGTHTTQSAPVIGYIAVRDTPSGRPRQ